VVPGYPILQADVAEQGRLSLLKTAHRVSGKLGRVSMPQYARNPASDKAWGVSHQPVKQLPQGP
jgi:hypothetical protein